MFSVAYEIDKVLVLMESAVRWGTDAETSTRQFRIMIPSREIQQTGHAIERPGGRISLDRAGRAVLSGGWPMNPGICRMRTGKGEGESALSRVGGAWCGQGAEPGGSTQLQHKGQGGES